MTEIRIDWLSDEHDCDNCGSSYAEGANVYFDEELRLELTPHAHCYDGVYYSESTVYKAILRELGHQISDE